VAVVVVAVAAAAAAAAVGVVVVAVEVVAAVIKGVLVRVFVTIPVTHLLGSYRIRELSNKHQPGKRCYCYLNSKVA